MKKSAFLITLCLLLGGMGLAGRDFTGMETWVVQGLLRCLREVGKAMM